MRVGVVGAGKISAQYSASLLALPQADVVAVADLDPSRAAALAAAHGARATSVEDLLAADDVDVVLNLTLPSAHAEVALAALANGKHVYGEKPLAASVEQARAVVDAGAAAGLRVGCAPDTVLGPGTQTARAALESGAIGTAHAATAFMVTPGHERWHPDPEFYYRPGGGPLLDMGPYYLTALVHLLGPVVRVTGMSGRSRGTRTIGSGPRAGATFDVEVPSHVTGVLEHADGALTTAMWSFDVWGAGLPRIEVYGTDGTLAVPDPNYFEGDVRLLTPAGVSPDGLTWTTLPPSAGLVGAGRGVGLADLVLAERESRSHLAADDVALHVLDVMQTLLAAAEERTAADVTTTCAVPPAVAGLVDLTA